MGESILDKFDKKALREFLEICNSFFKFDITSAEELALATVRSCRGNKVDRNEFHLLSELEKTWYESLDNGSPDYSVYDNVTYLSELWACWSVYSRQYLLSIKSNKSMEDYNFETNISSPKSIMQDMGDIDSVVDLGCGFGYSTAGLRELFPNANVHGTNIEGGLQFEVATRFGNIYDYTVVPSIQDIGLPSIDLVFASEYFEHIEKPIEHLEGILSSKSPKYLIIANAFTAKSIGHFNEYIHNGVGYDGKKISRLFNKTLRDNGYEKVSTRLWNSRPTYWRKRENNEG